MFENISSLDELKKAYRAAAPTCYTHKEELKSV